MKAIAMKNDMPWSDAIVEAIAKAATWLFAAIVAGIAILFGVKRKVQDNELRAISEATRAQDRAIRANEAALLAQEERFKYQDASIAELRLNVTNLKGENLALMKLLTQANEENVMLRRTNYDLEKRVKQLEQKLGGQ